MGAQYQASRFEKGQPKKLTPQERTRIETALAGLRQAAELIDSAGRGLAPHISMISAEALLELSVELERIGELLSRRALFEGCRSV